MYGGNPWKQEGTPWGYEPSPQRHITLYGAPMHSFGTAPTGWVCPKCGNVYAPSVPQCTECAKALKRR